MKPVVHLYTVCWDEADMLGFFFRHYDPWVDRYVVYDDGSIDGSLDILRAHPKVEVRAFTRTDPESFVASHSAMQNEVWKESRGQADWVIITAIDEHLWIPGKPMRSYLAEQQRRGVTFIPALGFNMIAAAMPSDEGRLIDRIDRGQPSPLFSKLSIFN
ncbi:MAG: glycosyltransferase family 2 protein, partial [Afipia sp.]